VEVVLKLFKKNGRKNSFKAVITLLEQLWDLKIQALQEGANWRKVETTTWGSSSFRFMSFSSVSQRATELFQKEKKYEYCDRDRSFIHFNPSSLRARGRKLVVVVFPGWSFFRLLKS